VALQKVQVIKELAHTYNAQPRRGRPLLEVGDHDVVNIIRRDGKPRCRFECYVSRLCPTERTHGLAQLAPLYLRMCHMSPCAHPHSNPVSGTRRYSTGWSCTAGKP